MRPKGFARGMEYAPYGEAERPRESPDFKPKRKPGHTRTGVHGELGFENLKPNQSYSFDQLCQYFHIKPWEKEIFKHLFLQSGLIFRELYKFEKVADANDKYKFVQIKRPTAEKPPEMSKAELEFLNDIITDDSGEFRAFSRTGKRGGNSLHQLPPMKPADAQKWSGKFWGRDEVIALYEKAIKAGVIERAEGSANKLRFNDKNS